MCPPTICTILQKKRLSLEKRLSDVCGREKEDRQTLPRKGQSCRRRPYRRYSVHWCHMKNVFRTLSPFGSCALCPNGCAKCSAVGFLCCYLSPNLYPESSMSFVSDFIKSVEDKLSVLWHLGSSYLGAALYFCLLLCVAFHKYLRKFPNNN